jgi:hypothetical protein
MINEQKIMRHIGVLALVLVSWGLFAYFGSIYAWAIIPVFSALAIMLGRPRGMLWWGLGWFMVAQYVASEARVGFLGYVDEMITLGMLGLVFINSRRPNSVMPERMRVLQPLPKIAFLFTLLAFFSAIVSRSIDIYFVMWCFQYLRMFVILFFVARFVVEADCKIFVHFVMLFSIVEAALNFGWMLHINPLPNVKEYWPSDFGVGTFAGCDSVAYYSVMVIVLCLAIILDPPSVREKRRAAALILLTFANFMITNTNHAYFILAAALVVFFVTNREAVAKIISIPALVGIGVIAALFLALFSLTDAGYALSPDNLAMRYEQFAKGTKLESYRRNFTELPYDTPLFWLVGSGPCKAGSCIGTALRRPIGDKYFNVLYNEEKYREDVREGSIATGPVTGILTYWSELGPLGLLMLSLTYLVALSKNRKLFHGWKTSNKYQLAIARAFPSLLAVMLAIAFLRDLFYMPWLIGLVWTWAVMAMLPLAGERDRCRKESSWGARRQGRERV